MNEKSKRSSNNTIAKIEDYLERKYGKEPRISPKELKKYLWNWH